MAYPSLVSGAVSRVARSTGTSVAIPRPPNTQPNHVTVAFLKMNTAATVTSTDWNVKSYSQNFGLDTGFRLWCLWRRDNGNVGPFTASWTGSATYSVTAASYQNVITTGDPIGSLSPLDRPGGPVPNVTWSSMLPYTQQATGTITIPTAQLVQGRMMIAWVFTTGTGVVPPSGETWGTAWSGASMDASYTTRRTQVLWRKIGFGEVANKTWTFPNVVDGALGMMIVNGVDGLTPFNSVARAESPEQIGLVFPSITTVEPNSLALYFGGKTNGHDYSVTGTSLTLVNSTIGGTPGPFGRSSVAASMAVPNAGTVASQTINEVANSGGAATADFGAVVAFAANPSTVETTSATTVTALGFDTASAEQLIVYSGMTNNGLSVTPPANFTTRAASGTNNNDVMVADYPQPSTGAIADQKGTLPQSDWSVGMMVSLLPAAAVSPPAQVTGLTVTLVSGAPQASWTTTSTATGYYVYRDGVRVTPSPVTATTWIDTGTVTPGLHTYQVSALNAGGEGPQSTAFSFSMPDLEPSPVGIIGPEKDRGWITGLVNGVAVQVRAVSLLKDGTRGTPTDALTLTPTANTAVATESYRNSVLSLPNVGLYLVGGDAAGSDTVEDYSANNTPGTLEGSPSLGADRLIASDPAPSIAMDGIDDYISMGDRFDFSALTPFFISVVFRPTVVGTTFRQIAQKSFNDASARTQGWEFGFSSTLGAIGSRILDSNFSRISGGSLTPNTIYRAIFTFDGAQMRIYLNGVLVATGPSTVSLRDTIADLRFGFGMVGQIGHIAVGQAAITQTQVDLLEQNARHGDDASPAAPTGVEATSVTGGVSLNWTPSESRDHKYYIIEQFLSSTWTRIVKIQATNYTVFVTGSESQSFRIYDEDSFGNLSAASATVTAAPTSGDPTPPVVTGAKSFNGDTQVTLDWDDSTFPNFFNYRVYRQAANGTYPTTPTYTTTVSQQVVTGLTNDITYRFRVTQTTISGQESSPVEIVAIPQAPVTGSGGLAIVNGQLRQTDATKKLMLPRTEHFYENSESVLKHGDTATLTSTDFVGIAQKVANDRSKMLLAYVANDRLYLASRIGSVQTVIDSKPLSALMLPNRSYWLRVRMLNQFVTMEHFIADPVLGGNPQDFLTRELTGTNSSTFGLGVLGQIGIYLATPTGWATRWVDDFKSASVGAPGTNALVVNKGNFPAEPLIELIGPMTAPEVTNITNSQTMRFTGNILQGERFFIDVASRTVVDQDNTSRMSQVALASDWIELEPGENQLRVSTTNPGFTTSMSVSWRSSWI